MSTAEAPRRIELPIEGMTCASCAVRIEKRLNQLEGVSASVNYATENAAVSFDPDQVAPEDLVAAVEAAGYHARLDEDGRDEPEADPIAPLRRRLLVSAALSLPVLLLAMVEPLQFDNWQWLSLQLATPVVLWGAWPFHRAAWPNLRHATATMDTLISLGTLAAWGWSVVALFFLGAGDPAMRMPFELVPGRGESASQIYLEVGLGRDDVHPRRALLRGACEAPRRRGARGAARAGGEGGDGVDEEGRETPRARRPSCRSATASSSGPARSSQTDGIVEEGRSAIDKSLVTGESVPVEVGPGDEVIGATVNVGGRLVVRATKVGADTALAQIARLVTEAQAGKAAVQRLADRVSGVFVPVVIVLAAATLGYWLGTGEGASFAFAAAVAVLIVACPCALGLATPTALLVGTGRGAQLGILIKGPEVLESTRRVDTILLDKTGTVTTGTMALARVVTAAGADRGGGAAARRRARARVRASGRAARSRAAAAAAGLGAPVELPQPRGSRRRGDRRRPRRCRRAPLAAGGMGRSSCRPSWPRRRRIAEADGRTAVAAGWDGEARALFVVADEVKPTSREAVARLRSLGLRPILLTGDNEPTARRRGRGGRDRGRDRRGAPGREGRRRAQPAGRGSRRGDGRRRRQRCARARTGRSRPRDRHRHRRGDRGERPDARGRRPPHRGRRDPARAPDAAPRSRRICSGRSPTTSPRSRSPPPACSTR